MRYIRYSAFFLLVCVSSVDYAREVINSWVSDITVHTDRTLSVTESITIQTAGETIRHGIVRLMPTHYYTWWGVDRQTPCTVETVLLDGKSVLYQVKDQQNGIAIYIGDAAQVLSPGVHTYTIQYRILRQLGLYETFDELAWNVNGTGWAFPIERMTAYVRLPDGIDSTLITNEAYTGYAGDKGSAYQVHTLADGTIIYKTTRALQPHENMTIVTTWPKGFIDTPTIWQEWRWWVSDHLPLLWLLFALISIMIGMIICVMRARKKVIARTVIPQFDPPDDISPGLARMALTQEYDTLVLASELLMMAVRGYMQLSLEKTGWRGRQYRFNTTNTPVDQKNSLYAQLYTTLFNGRSSVVLGKAYPQETQQLHTQTEQYMATQTIGWFRDDDYMVYFIGISCALVLPLIWYFDSLQGWAGIIAGAFVGILLVIFHRLLPKYTQKGEDIRAQVQGFKLFLATTETDRLAIIGTPPEKTPALYETYLPYALAFGVEKQWAAQFAPIFERMAAAGTPYTPSWASGVSPIDMGYYPAGFGTDVSQAVNTTIPSSSSAPGTSSSSRGQGSSGSGGGGGGGYGW